METTTYDPQTLKSPELDNDLLIGNDETIGIWKPENRNGKQYYIRDTNQNIEWGYWSSTHEIPPKSNKKRVILLGESVARGYLYDPYYNPAQVLQSVMDASALVDSEVIDLARTNLDLIGLQELTSSCLALDPDAIVVFAGNNWFYSVKRSLNSNDLEKLAKILEEEGTLSFEKFLVDRFQCLIEKLLDKFLAIGKNQNIPFYFIIPEFNLRDWKSSINEQIPSFLPKEKITKWEITRTEAEKAFIQGEQKELARLAQKLIDLDHTHPIGYEMLATAKLEQGMDSEAKLFLEKARDTSIFSRAFSKPRTHSIIRETVLQKADNVYLNVIDLPQVFENYLNGKLPGRELFLDYCHLTDEGIQIAMGVAAKTLISKFSNVEVDLDNLNLKSYNPDTKVKAIAYICAAVHNAHYGQSYEILEYLCKEAVKTSPVAIELMENFADFSTRRTSNTLCKSHEKLIENECIEQYGGGLGFLHKRDQKLLDVELVNAMVTALQTVGVDIEAGVNTLRKKEHGINGKTISLMESFYSSTSYDIYPGKKPSYFQSRHTDSPFFIIAEENTATNLEITYRTPNRSVSNDKVKISVNGTVIKDLPSSEKWRRVSFTVPGKVVRDGVNELKISWSTDFEFGNLTDTPSLDPSFDQVLGSLFRIYGEIIEFKASAVEKINS